MSARDFMGAGSLTSNAYTEVEDADPRVGLVNLADVMLVFACGLMLAMVTYWNLDISAMTEVVQADEMQEVSGIEDLEDQMNGGGGNSFTQLGMVYEDPTTGKIPPRLVNVESNKVMSYVNDIMDYITPADYEAAKRYVANPEDYDFKRILNW